MSRSVCRFLGAGLGACALMLASACASAPPEPLEDVLSRAARAPVASGYRIAVAPLEIAPDAGVRLTSDETSCPVPVDLAGFEAEVMRVVEATGRFEQVARLFPPTDPILAERGGAGAAPADGAGGDDAERRAAEGRTIIFEAPRELDEALLYDRAFEAGADLVLRLRAREHRAGFVDHNGWFWANQIILACMIWPAYFVADERYEGWIQVEAELLSVLNRRRVASRVFDVKSGPKDLDHFDRGWLALGSVVTPEWLDPDNYTQAGRTVLRHARNRLDEELSGYLAEVALPGAAVGGRLAVCVGVGDYEGRVQRAAVFSDDARTFARLLEEAGSVPAMNVLAMTEAEPRAEAMLRALVERAERCGPDDTLFFYFSGFGFQTGDQVYLVPSDVDPKDPVGSSVSLAAIDAALRRARGRQVVILDTSFGPRDLLEDGAASVPVRTLSRAAGRLGRLAPPDGAPEGPLERLASAPRRTVLLSTAPGTAAHLVNADLAEQRGFFTARLARAVDVPSADRSGDRQLDLLEMFEFARYQTTQRTQATDVVQEPRVLGVPPRDVLVAPAARAEGGRSSR